ncbi:MAG TPA: C40 family peptidase [Lichenihabitans sp.]|jgi:hypothetical protein|nr:C40 family peptidase [Lichenihabitans sp.]
MTEPVTMQVVAATTALRREPQSDAPLDTEALHGERVTVFEEREGWVRARLESDGYEGFLASQDLRPARAEAPTHRVAALRSFVFPGPNIKLPPLTALPFGARIVAREIRGDFLRIDEGFLWARHLADAATIEPDVVGIAERFLGVPYLWGGKTALGIDCSGLVQLSLAAAGRKAPRDSGPQERALGMPLAEGAPLRRGDLAFWRGHVGLMRDADTLLHANGHAMAVTSEPFAEARTRIVAAGAGDVTSVRRV